eukprot:10616-Eustigmatos_ZCMA.PRE.1
MKAALLNFSPGGEVRPPVDNRPHELCILNILSSSFGRYVGSGVSVRREAIGCYLTPTTSETNKATSPSNISNTMRAVRSVRKTASNVCSPGVGLTR